MKPLGIVLLFVNLLAAAGVAYLASQAWATRQQQRTAIYKHELAMSGLPLDPTAAGPRTLAGSKDEDVITLPAATAPAHPSTDVRAKVLIDHFRDGVRGGDLFTGMSSAAPLSVLAEVDEVKKQVDARAAGLPNDLAKITFLVGTANGPGILSLLADDFDERLAYREWLTEAAKPAGPEQAYAPADLWALARAALDAKFDQVLAKADVPGAQAYQAAKRDARAARDTALDEWLKATLNDVGAKRKAYQDAQFEYWKKLTAKNPALSDADRRRKAAGLLAVLDPSPGGQKRTALVVGLNDYTAAVLERTQRLSTMPERYDRQGETELTNFVVIYDQKLATSRDLDRLLQRQKDITATFATQEREGNAAVQTRTKHRDDAKGRTDDLDKTVKRLSAEQLALEKEIFDLQQLVAARFDQLFRLEAQVFEAEKQKARR